MKWGVIGKGGIPHVQKEAEEVIRLLKARDQEVLVDEELRAIGEETRPIAQLDDEVDLFVTIGGDGTILHTQHHTDKPVLGINAGAIGFLAEVEPPHAAAAIDEVVAGRHRIEERHRLRTTLDGQVLSDAINEVTLQTSRIAKLIRFHVRVDGELLDTFRGDGIIVSTPTGSTGYAMSVGGPLVHPRVNGIVLAPIAPFKLASRPWVVPADSRIEVTLLERDSAQGLQQARAVIDGQMGHNVDTGSTLRIGLSDHKARFVRLTTGFYERVRTKLTR